MLCLGIECTAHTFGAAVVEMTGKDSGRVLSNEKHMFTTESGGMIPTEVANHHREHKDAVIAVALKKAGKKISDIQLISVSNAPGLAPTLLAGLEAAKELSLKNNIPLLGVNHCVAHLEIGNLLTSAKDPVLLYASGVNSQIIAFEGGKYRIFGETLDQGIGNFLDSFARYAGLGFPGGPKIEQLALKCQNKKNLIELPYLVKGMDVGFGGMLTNVKQKFDKGINLECLSYAIQETAFAMLVEVTERAMAHTDKTELLLGGGVACNKRLQEMCRMMCEERGAKLFVPENQFLVDNAAMIAWLGLLEHNAGVKQDIDELDINPYERTDQVNVGWRE